MSRYARLPIHRYGAGRCRVCVGTSVMLALLSVGTRALAQSEVMATSEIARAVRVEEAGGASHLQPTGLLRIAAADVAESASLSLADFEQMALQNNPTLAQAEAAVTEAGGRWTQAGLYPNPTLSYQAGEMGNDGRAGQQGAFISQEFVTGGKLEWSRHAAGHEIERVRQEQEAQRYRVLTSVRIAFYDVLTAQRRREIVEQLVELSQQAVQATQAMVEAQQAAKPDLLLARIEVNTAHVLLSQAEANALAAWRRLAAVVGSPEMMPTHLAGDFSPTTDGEQWQAALDRLLASSPEVRAAEADVARLRAAVQRACVEPIPNVNVQAGAQYDTATEYTIAGLSVGIQLPIYNRNQGNIQAAEAKLIRSQHELDRIRLDLQRRLAVVMRDYIASQKAVERYSKQILPDAKETLDLVNMGYRQGEFDYLRVLTAQRTYFQTSMAYLDAARQWWTAKLTIDGLLLTDGLDSPNR